jgi:hypothetical protein
LLMNSFKLQLNKKLVKELSDDHLPDVPIKNIDIRDVASSDAVKIINKYKAGLKECHLNGFNCRTSALMRTIYEINLETLYIDSVPLILNYEKQHVSKELEFSQDELGFALEIMKHGRCK